MCRKNINWVFFCFSRCVSHSYSASRKICNSPATQNVFLFVFTMISMFILWLMQHVLNISKKQNKTWHYCWAHLSFFFLAHACMEICDSLHTVNLTTLDWEEWYKEAAALFWSQGLVGFVWPTCYGTIMYYILLDLTVCALRICRWCGVICITVSKYEYELWFAQWNCGGAASFVDV